MELKTIKSRPEDIKTDILGMFCYNDGWLLAGIGPNFNIAPFITNKDFKGKLNETFLIPTFNKIAAKKVLLIGLGKKKDFKTDNMRQAAATGTIFARESDAKTFTIFLDTAKFAQEVSEGAFLSSYQFNKFISDKEKKKQLETLEISCSQNINSQVQTGKKLAESANYARSLADLPANIATPAYLANEAKKLSKLNIKIKIMEKPEMKKLGMNAILGVSAGSDQPPKLVIMEYNGGKKGPVVLVGKGVTFDAGGLDLKPTKYMENMHYDKCGATTVFGIMHAVASLKLPIHVIGLTPFVENMVGGSAQKPLDIIKSFSGKTIEIGNTDAEGRLIMADTIAYSKKFKPKAIMDFATLTGACVVALGHHAAAILGNDEKLIEKIKKASSRTDERVWQLPLWNEYKEQIKSTRADVKNTGIGSAGTITAAAFLENFVPEKIPWAHFDIAGVANVEEIKNPKTYASSGATGFGVRLVTELLKNW